MHSESSKGVLCVDKIRAGLGAMNRGRNRGRSSPDQRRVSVLVQQILGAATR
jgi:hypothetical protein